MSESKSIKTLRSLALITTTALSWTLAGGGAIAQSEGPKPVYMNKTWVVLKSHNVPDKKVYRRYSITNDIGLANVMMLQCPRHSGHYVHISLEMKRVGPIEEVFPSGFEQFKARVLVDGRSSFDLPGEVIKTELFFDRAPDTWKGFDRVLEADEFQMRFGQQQVRVIYKIEPKLTNALPDLIKAMHGGPVSFLSTEEALRDCRRYRGE